ncbi:hypothetical protein LXL04_002752 [Taraxacum kok-saghyz]
MAMKLLHVLFLTFCFFFLISQGLAKRSKSVHPRPSKFSFRLCWAALYDLESCYTEFVRAAQNTQLDLGIGPTCCKAGKTMDFGCWSILFPFNPYFPITLKLYCSRYWAPNPKKPFVASPPPVNADAPTPNGEEPTAYMPIDEGRVALPLLAPSRSIKGPSMNKPNVESN